MQTKPTYDFPFSSPPNTIFPSSFFLLNCVTWLWTNKVYYRFSLKKKLKAIPSNWNRMMSFSFTNVSLISFLLSWWWPNLNMQKRAHSGNNWHKPLDPKVWQGGVGSSNWHSQIRPTMVGLPFASHMNSYFHPDPKED